ncbi:MAG: RNA polymerase sigma factor [Pseudomonadota bacterium]
MVNNTRNPEERAFLETFLSELPGLRRYFIARNGCSTTAEDLVQDVWIRLSRKADRRVRSPRAYLWQIAANLATDRRRVDGRKPAFAELSSATEVSDGTGTPEQTVLAREALQLVGAALQELPSRRREIFIAVNLHGENSSCLAERFGISRRMVQIETRLAFEHCLEALARQ